MEGALADPPPTLGPRACVGGEGGRRTSTSLASYFVAYGVASSFGRADSSWALSSSALNSMDSMTEQWGVGTWWGERGGGN